MKVGFYKKNAKLLCRELENFSHGYLEETYPSGYVIFPKVEA